MRILPDNELTTKLVDTAPESALPNSEILLAGKSTGKFVPGAVLEAAIRWNDFYLLFMTDSIPQEDTLGIHLFDKELNLLDTARLGAMYSTGTFSQLALIEPNTVEFHFIGGTDWRVQLYAKPAFGLPFISDPKGVWRKFGFTRHFKLVGDPHP